MKSAAYSATGDHGRDGDSSHRHDYHWPPEPQTLTSIPPSIPGIVVPMGKQKASIEADDQSRRALEDIGNVVNLRPVEGKLQPRSSTKKKFHTPTSVPTARSKVACGIIEKLKEPVVDIDASDRANQLAVVEYVEDIYKFYKFAEEMYRPIDYMGSQMELNKKMRAILVDWLIEVHHMFGLMPEVIFLSVDIVDRYLSLEMVAMRELQLVGIGAMLIASKYEEICAPPINNFILFADRVYTREQILAIENAILDKLEWNLSVPTLYQFLVRFIKAGLCDKEMEHMVFFLAELSLMQYSMLIVQSPSLVAASAVFAARCTLKKVPLWNETLRSYTGFTKSQLVDCAQVMVSSHGAAPHSKLKAVYNKYSSSSFNSVALHPPATQLQDAK